MPSGAAASAAGLRGQAAAAAGGGRRAHAFAAATATPASLLRVLAHGAPGLVPVPLAPRQLRVGQRPREGGGDRGRAVAEAAGDACEDGDACASHVPPTVCTCSRLMHGAFLSAVIVSSCDCTYLSEEIDAGKVACVV